MLKYSISENTPYFEGENEMEYFSIGVHIYTRDLSLSQPFWVILATHVYEKIAQMVIFSF